MRFRRASRSAFARCGPGRRARPDPGAMAGRMGPCTGPDRRRGGRTVLDTRRIDRRTFVADIGKGAFALAVITLAACRRPRSPSRDPAVERGRSSSPHPARPRWGASRRARRGRVVRAAGRAGATSLDPRQPRVRLGVHPRAGRRGVLARGGEAAIVDTGVAGSADAIEAALARRASTGESPTSSSPTTTPTMPAAPPTSWSGRRTRRATPAPRTSPGSPSRASSRPSPTATG